MTEVAGQRHGTAWLEEQVPVLAEIADAVLAEQRVHVRSRQPGTGQLPFLELAAGDEDGKACAVPPGAGP